MLQPPDSSATVPDAALPPAVPVNLLYPRRRFVSRKFEAFQSFCTEFYERRAQHYVPSYCVEVVSFPKFPN